MAEALPLADQPHLLTPNSRREELFAMPKQQQPQPTVTVPMETSGDSPLEQPPVRLGLSRQIKIQEDIPMPELPPMMPNIVTAIPTALTENEIAEETDQSPPKLTLNGPVPTIKVDTEPMRTDESSQSKQENLRPTSPKPGPSREPTENEVYFKKTRHYYQKAEKEYENSRVQQNNTTQQEEPQDLSHTSNAIKMEIDEMSDESEVEWSFRTKTPQNNENQISNKECDESGNVRPPIIVTRKKVQQAIEFATATVLAKTKKNSLAECEQKQVGTGQDSNDFELPTDFFELSDEESRSSTNKGRLTNHLSAGNSASLMNSNSNSSGKSVIVRAGSSVSRSRNKPAHLEIKIGCRYKLVFKISNKSVSLWHPRKNF